MVGSNDLATRLRFKRIDKMTCDQLQAMWPLVSREIGAILTRFYAHMGGEPLMASRVGDGQRRLETARTKD